LVEIKHKEVGYGHVASIVCVEFVFVMHFC